MLLVTTYVKDGKTMNVKTVIHPPTQSEGLKIIDGVVTGIGTCTDTKLYICSSLKTLEIPNGVTSIAPDAFQGCQSLTSITIPHSVTNIGYNTFLGCSALTTIHYRGTTQQWNSIEKLNGPGPTTITVHCTDGNLVDE